MGIPQLLVHDHDDSVGVVVVEGLKIGTDILWVVTHDNSSFQLASNADIPIGHKVALKDLKAGDTLIDMIQRTANGRYTAAEALGGHREFSMTKLYRSA